jgi:hypothetical protein
LLAAATFWDTPQVNPASLEETRHSLISSSNQEKTRA